MVLVVEQYIVNIPQYNMIVKYDLNLYYDQSALPDKQKTLMDASIESVYGDIVIKSKKLLV